MSFRDRMKVAVSNADRELLEELRFRGLLGHGFHWQQEIVLLWTKPECYWDGNYPNVRWPGVALFLDGPPHKGKQLDKDEVKRTFMEKQGWTVQPFPYKYPLSQRERRLIGDKVEATLRPRC